MNYLLVKLEAPLMSFGGTIIDAKGKTFPFPSKSLLTGLLGNALGYDYHSKDDLILLDRLQNRIAYAVRVDLDGTMIEDYQTVDLSLPHMLDKHAWTTHGFLDQRGGGNSTGTHIRIREYIADACYLVAISLCDLEDANDKDPSLLKLKEALISPARPIFIGRKSCLPSAPLFVSIEQAEDFKALFSNYPCLTRELDHPKKENKPNAQFSDTRVKESKSKPYRLEEFLDSTMPRMEEKINDESEDVHVKNKVLWAWLPLDLKEINKLSSRDKVMHLVDHRDFKNQIFGGSRMMYQVKITLQK